MRAREPDVSDVVTRDGVRIAYDVYGDDNPVTIVLLPAWIIAHSRLWKMQVPVLARRHRVIVVEGRGNGRSDRPAGPDAYSAAEYVADAIAVLDATGTDRAVAMGVSMGGDLVVEMATSYPDRTIGGALVAPALARIGSPLPEQRDVDFHARLDADEGWALYNEHAWQRDLPTFAQFFWSQVFTEPHSTKATEDGVAWTAGTDAATLIATELAPSSVTSRADAVERLRSVRCPTLVIVGSDDAIVSADCGTTAAEVMGSDLLVVERGGHCPQARDPVRVNRSLLEFVDRVAAPQSRSPVEARWTRALSRPRRVLYVSSPIGLGHARRDLAIARELGKLRDGVQIDWLAQEPVTTFLAGVGERVHPASAQLSSESQHIESEAFEHQLHAFQAIRRMDEVLLSNFSVFQELVESGDYDLVVGDEAWDIDHFWHENPELKRSAYAWMTDFVGWLPMPEGGPEEAALTTDYNAEMIEHVERFRRVRDCAIFIGEPDDIVPDTFGPGLPSIRGWTQDHFAFAGHVTGLDRADVERDRRASRQLLGYDPDVPLAVVTVGGSAVGRSLLVTVMDAYPRMRKEIDGLQMMVVAGPRVDVVDLPHHDGVDVRGFVPDLPLHLAACDVAIVQGGLTTTMELVELGRPFVYVPLGQHFEQQRHVRHRLERYGAGRCVDHACLDAESLTDALLQQLAAPCQYPPIPADGARRAAAMLADLI